MNDFYWSKEVESVLVWHQFALHTRPHTNIFCKTKQCEMNWSTTLPRELWHEAKPLFCLRSLSLQPIRLLLWAETSSLLLLPWTEHHLLLCFGLLIVAFISQCRNTLNSEDSLLFLSIVPSQRSIHVNTGLQIRSTLIWLSLKKNVVSQPVKCV